MSFIKILEDWKSQSLVRERYYQKMECSIIEGQELYLISVFYTENDELNLNPRIITKSIFFQTHFLGIHDSSNIDSSGDEYVCKQILKYLDDFFDKEFYEK
jgi:hypothetical protein